MSRWINRIIARHLGPEQNVRPLLAGIYQRGAPGQGIVAADEAPFPEAEEMTQQVRAQADDETGLGGREKAISGEGAAGIVERPESERAKIEPEREAYTKGQERPVLGQEGPDLTGEEIRTPATGALADKQKMIGRREAPEKYISSDLRPAEETETTEQPGPDGSENIRRTLERTTKYTTRVGAGEPVLQDLGEGFPSEQMAVGKDDVVRTVRGTVRESASPDITARQTIHISIGRIEIKAVAPAALPSEGKISPVKKDTAIMGLDQFLEQRNPVKR